ncbi:hypothetical protein [Ruminococcus difficilis]|uniref:Uncharacterized protein n=1 Tax=Ruminococcus difficilis TaxID=2763069 RepID=A0A935C7R9_9FIRM|nr:hypothetical protein [Ruminococcus difficilis]MBK6090243.1 hypothetical protein [Ruminococcus difficilis]MBQ1587009.1 hypothetical protein [Ruminococcus sp.]
MKTKAQNTLSSLVEKLKESTFGALCFIRYASSRLRGSVRTENFHLLSRDSPAGLPAARLRTPSSSCLFTELKKESTFGTLFFQWSG